MFDHALQADFIASTLQRHKARPLKLATYHVPLYPSHRSFDIKRAVRGRQVWGPRFDEHGLTIAFEHHDHTLKRTKRLKAGEPDPTGTLYLGDGCMGNSERTVDPTRPYLAKAMGRFHVWVADLSATGATVRALSPDGRELDRVVVAATASGSPASRSTGERSAPASASEAPAR
jgi:hypothetical protein